MTRRATAALVALAVILGSLFGASVAKGATHRHAPRPPYGLSRLVVAEWRHVNECEEGGRWHVHGSTFDGGLGISHRAWNHFRPWWADPIEWRATALEQIYTARRIEESAGLGGYVPDQDGTCGSW